jgi:hypothetical protein
VDRYFPNLILTLSSTSGYQQRISTRCRSSKSFYRRSRRQESQEQLRSLLYPRKPTLSLIHPPKYLLTPRNQTAGASSLGDNPVTGTYHETRVFSDTDPDIAEYIQKRNAHTEYHQRTTDLTVLETGEAVGVRTYIIMPPLIFGQGTGPFNKISVQIPSMVRGALAAKKSGMVKDCTAVWSHVHVQDLAELYKILFTKVFIEKAGEDKVPSGRKGIYFAETGEASWRSVAEEVGRVGKELGKLETDKLQEIDVQEAANRWTDGSLFYVEAAFLSK